MTDVGFDLDLTLVDSRAGIVACLQHTLSHFQAAPVPDASLATTIGEPLGDILGRFLPATEVPAAVERYRATFAEVALPSTIALPGAVDLVAGLRSEGGRVVVVSTKIESAIRLVLDHVGLEVDAIAGGVFGHDKAGPIRAHALDVFVGDHPGDMVAARTAGVTGIGVTTGAHDAAALLAAGADRVVEDLTEVSALVRR